MTFAFPWILFSLFLQGIKLEEQKPGPQKNKVGWAGDRQGIELACWGLLSYTNSYFHQEPLKWPHCVDRCTVGSKGAPA